MMRHCSAQGVDSNSSWQMANFIGDVQMENGPDWIGAMNVHKGLYSGLR
jgi:hypothetical protein